MLCPKCGRDIGDGGFCPFCGIKLSQNITEINNSNSDNMVKPEKENIDEPDGDYIDINNNPFSFSGRITRVGYFLIIIFIRIIAKYVYDIKYSYDKSHDRVLFYIFLLSLLLMTIIEFFATIKRLRDIKWNPYLSLLYFIPYAPFVIPIVLICIKGKYNDYKNIKQN